MLADMTGTEGAKILVDPVYSCLLLLGEIDFAVGLRECYRLLRDVDSSHLEFRVPKFLRDIK